MRIAIEALGIEHSGGGRAATLNLLKPLFTLDDQNDYLVYLSAPEPSLEGLNPHVRQQILPVRNRFLARLCAQVLLPLHVRRSQVDLVHFAKNQVVVGCGIPTIATVYDLTTLRYPRAYPRVDVMYWRYILSHQLRQMRRIIAISQSTASDLESFYGILSKRITVIYPGYDPCFRVVGRDQVSVARERLGLPEKYLVHVGSISLKKNLSTLVEAFLDFRRRTNFSGKLVFVGANYHKGRDERFVQLVAQPSARDAIALLGYVPKDLLVDVLNGAQAFLFPSLHEGFGIAVLEAMACGTPVIAHAVGAVCEVIGDAGVLVEPPTDIDIWSQAIERVAADASQRERLRQAGLERAALFSAEHGARQTLQVYSDVYKANCPCPR